LKICRRRAAVDDFEFPFLLGVTSEPADWEKLKLQLSNMDGYGYFGSIGDDNKHVFSITPHQVYPQDADETIKRRMTLRMQAFYDKFTATSN
jgi:hypothetical protein